MKQMSLVNIARACEGELHVTEKVSDLGFRQGDMEQTEPLAFVLDSRQVQQGSLFFATMGERVDGHRFIGTAFEKGACCVVTEKMPEEVETQHGVSTSGWGAYILVKNSFLALKEIAEYYRSTLRIPVIGVTGSVGKTSTKEFIAGVLSENYSVLKTEGNFNNEVGLPLTLLRIRDEHQVAVVEMGISEFGEMRRLSKIAKPDICVITNIGQCHLESLKTRDGILKAKTEIFEYMSERGDVCLNGDDDKLSAISEVQGKKPHFFGLGDGCGKEVYVTDIIGKGLFGSEGVLHLAEAEVRLPIRVTWPGEHMVINAAAAACVANLLGLTPDQIAEGIKKVVPVGGRSNLIRLPHHVLIDDCYNANPVSMKAAIDLLDMAEGFKVAVLGDMFELGEDSDSLHAQVGAYAAHAGLERIICIGKHSSHMYKEALEVRKHMEAQMVDNGEGEMAAEAGCQEIFYLETKVEFQEALKGNGDMLLPKDSTILLKASHGMGFEEIVKELEMLLC